MHKILLFILSTIFISSCALTPEGGELSPNDDGPVAINTAAIPKLPQEPAQPSIPKPQATPKVAPLAPAQPQLEVVNTGFRLPDIVSTLPSATQISGTSPVKEISPKASEESTTIRAAE